MRTVEVISAQLTHLELLAPLFDAYRVFYGQPPELAAARHFLEARLRTGDSIIFLALLDGPVGFAQLYPSFSSVSLNRLWILNDLFVIPEARRKAVASALLKRVQSHALETGEKGLSLQTATHNHAAQALYEAHGWRKDVDFLSYTRSA